MKSSTLSKMKVLNLYQNGTNISKHRLHIGLTVLFLLFGFAYTEKNYQSTCETIPSEIHITKGDDNI